MYSLLRKKEKAHEAAIWACASGRQFPEPAAAIGDEEKEPPEEPKKTGEPIDFIVTGGLDDVVKVWDIKQNNIVQLRRILNGPTLGIISLAVSLDGKTIASSSMDSSLCIFDTRSGERKHRLFVGQGDLWNLAFSPDSKYVVSGSSAGKVSMYNVETAETDNVLDPQNGKFALSIAYSPDGKYIACGTTDGIITIFDVPAGKLLKALEGHAMPVRSLCFSPDSQLLLTASDDGHMKLYDVVRSDVLGTLSGHTSWVLCVSWSKDGRHFASSSSDKSVKIWDLNEKKCLHTFNEHTDQVWGVQYVVGNDKLISVSEDESLNIYYCPPNV